MKRYRSRLALDLLAPPSLLNLAVVRDTFCSPDSLQGPSCCKQISQCLDRGSWAPDTDNMTILNYNNMPQKCRACTDQEQDAIEVVDSITWQACEIMGQ